LNAGVKDKIEVAVAARGITFGPPPLNFGEFVFWELTRT